MNTSDNGRFLPELLFTTLLIFIFAISALGIVLVGGEVYKDIIARSDDSYEMRTAISYVATKVRQGDRSGMIEMSELEGIPALVIHENVEGHSFEQWIYHYNGALWEAYISTDVALRAEDGLKIMEVENVTMSADESTVHIEVRTAAGRTAELSVGLRSGG